MASSPATTGIARRRANLRRGVIAVLVILCLALFTGYFRESDGGPLHGAQSAAASVISPVQEVATKAVEPFRDAWGWASSLKDARDRAASLDAEVKRLRGEAVFSVVEAQRLAELEQLLGVESLVDASRSLGGYTPVAGPIVTRSVSPWWRSARVGIGSSDGVIRTSPVLAGSQQGAALVGIVTNVSARSADVAFITDGRTEVGARIPDAGPYFGLLSSITPGQLQMSGIPKEAAVKTGQAVVTGGFGVKGLESPYPPGLPVGVVTSVGTQEVDVDRTVQVTPYVDPRTLSYLSVLVPRSPEAIARARG
jgi:rod shape-determining protein MreC